MPKSKIESQKQLKCYYDQNEQKKRNRRALIIAQHSATNIEKKNTNYLRRKYGFTIKK